MTMTTFSQTYTLMHMHLSSRFLGFSLCPRTTSSFHLVASGIRHDKLLQGLSLSLSWGFMLGCTIVFGKGIWFVVGGVDVEV